MNILILYLVEGFWEGVLVVWKIYMLFVKYLSNNLQEIYLRNCLQNMMKDCFCGMVDRWGLGLFPTETIVKDPHHRKSLTHH